MEFANIFTDDDAVSPVIGVILMVAITVILAAVIGTFVLGLGDQVSNTSPSASFSFDFDGEDHTGDDFSNTISSGASSPDEGTLTITHDGGDKIEASQLSATGSDVAGSEQDFVDDGKFGTDSEVSAGTSTDLGAESDDTVRIVWAASGGGDTATLGKWTGPDA